MTSRKQCIKFGMISMLLSEFWLMISLTLVRAMKIAVREIVRWKLKTNTGNCKRLFSTTLRALTRYRRFWIAIHMYILCMHDFKEGILIYINDEWKNLKAKRFDLNMGVLFKCLIVTRINYINYLAQSRVRACHIFLYIIIMIV